MVELRTFRAKYLSRLLKLKLELISKYPDKAERIIYLVDVIASKLQNLRIYSMTDYLFTIHLASKEFPEFNTLTPPVEEVEELLEEEKEGVEA